MEMLLFLIEEHLQFLTNVEQDLIKRGVCQDLLSGLKETSISDEQA